MTNSIKYALLNAVFLFAVAQVSAQDKSMAITIDDVPNTLIFEADGYRSHFLTSLDTMNIPFTIFVNEGRIYKTDSTHLNLDLLERWCGHAQAIIGNHTYAHSRYSSVGLESFLEDIEKGETLIKPLASDNNKTLQYFRFPFNDLGKDSLQHAQIDSFLLSKNYISTPFTIESSDWMFNYVYQNYLKKGKKKKAKKIAEEYVEKTMDLLVYYEGMADSLYGRSIQHIYLCHDNELNRDYLHQIVQEFKQRAYRIVPLDEALKDPVYQQEDVYNKKWGISWLYRWMTNPKERKKYMMKEPDFSHIETLYQELSSAKDQ